MGKGNRSLVYLYMGAESHCGLLLQKMLDDDWDIYKTTSIDNTVSLIKQESICLGIIHFGATLEAGETEQLDRLMRRAPNTVWIGIAPAELLPTLIDTRLIPGYFYDYHTEPVVWLRLSHSLGHAYGMAHASRHFRQLRKQKYSTADMVAVSDEMQDVLHQIKKIASVDASVMISGESGTGKELTAGAIHKQSKRSNGPLIIVNCGAISPNLIHSELFGHEKGAFTGAYKRKIGRLEAANGGTIFLDEIADLPLDQQVNLLRFLQEKTIERVGGVDSIPVDVRVLAASNIDLHEAVARKSFREDLLYRLNVIQLRLPALRDRIEDIEPLAQHFFSIFAKERNHNVNGFSPQALKAMRSYSWPGNVRELLNRVRRATIMCEGRQITRQDLEISLTKEESWTVTLAQARIEAERHAIKSSLRQTKNNITEAARHLGIARMTLYRLMQKHQLTTINQEPASYYACTAYTDNPQALPFSLSTKFGGSQ